MDGFDTGGDLLRDFDLAAQEVRRGKPELHFDEEHYQRLLDASGLNDEQKRQVLEALVVDHCHLR